MEKVIGKLEKIGVFNTPQNIEFGCFTVYDLREDKSKKVAEWYVLRHRAIQTSLVVTNAEEGVAAIGSFKKGEQYLKWSLSLSIIEDVVLASFWRGEDCSRTGQHGTQQYAYLATDLKGSPQIKISGMVLVGRFGADNFKTEATPEFPSPRRGYGMERKWQGITLCHRAKYSVSSGPSLNCRRGLFRRIPAKTWFIYNEIKYDAGEEWNYYEIVKVIRNKINLSLGLKEALLIEDFILDGKKAVAKLVQFYFEKNVIDSKINSEYAFKKKKQVQDESEGVMFDLTGYFRRMGASNNRDVWVIRSDGTFREADELIRRKDYPEGDKRWYRVENNELALKWHCPSISRAWSGSEYKVVHYPVKITAEQKKAVSKIEKEIKKITGEGLGKFFSQKNQKNIITVSKEESKVFSTDEGVEYNPFVCLEVLRDK